MSKANGAAPPDPLDELDDVISELEGSEWNDEITETQIIVQPGATVNVDQTGRHQALTNNIPTKPDNPQPDSQPPKAKFALAVLDRIQPAWLRAPVVIVALGLVALLAWRGIALAGLLP